MQTALLASEAFTALQRYFPSRAALLIGAFCCLGVSVFMIQVQRLSWANLLNWRILLVGAVLPAIGIVIALIISREFAMVFRYALGGGAALVFAIVSVQIVVTLVKSV